MAIIEISFLMIVGPAGLVASDSVGWFAGDTLLMGHRVAPARRRCEQR